jgi:hypothetical protein
MQAYETEVEGVEELSHSGNVQAFGIDANEQAADPYEVSFESFEPASDGKHLHLAVETKKRDNLALGETLVQIGLLRPQEMLDVRIAQIGGEDLCESLIVVSSIRSRLGDMLLQEKQITSEQLEFALDLQRKRGGLLGEILVSLGWLDRETLDATLSAQRERRAA